MLIHIQETGEECRERDEIHEEENDETTRAAESHIVIEEVNNNTEERRQAIRPMHVSYMYIVFVYDHLSAVFDLKSPEWGL